MTNLRASPSGRLLDVAAGEQAAGLQTAWAIDPLTGNDEGPGTVAAPLRTMAEFNARWQNILARVPATLQLVGDVLDQPLWLRGTNFATGASLTVSGTVTTSPTVATITVVTGLNVAGATLQPFQLTTTGIDWTTVALGSRLLASNGSIAWIRNVVDANNVVVGAFSTSATISVVPTAGLTLSVQTLSQALAPNLNISAVDKTTVVSIKDLSFTTCSFSTNATFSGNLLINGCEFKSELSAIVKSVGGLTLRASRFTMVAGSSVLTFVAAASALNVFAAVFSGATSGAISSSSSGTVVHQHTCILNAQLSVTQGAFVSMNTSCHIQHTTVAVLIDTLGFLNTGICSISGSAGASIGVDVRCGWFIWNSTGKPTITGATDCRVGNVTYTYAALGDGKTSSYLDAVPPVTNLLLNTGATRGPAIATMSRNA